MTNRLGDRIAAGLLLALAIAVFAYTFTFPPPIQDLDPGMSAFPRIAAVIIGVFALVTLLRPEGGEALPRGGAALRVIVTAVLLFGYALVLDLLGFVLTTVLFLVAVLVLVGVRRPVLLAVVPLGVSLGLFFVFRFFLEVPLPVSGLGGLPI